MPDLEQRFDLLRRRIGLVLAPLLFAFVLSNVIGKNMITLLPNASSFGFLVAASGSVERKSSWFSACFSAWKHHRAKTSKVLAGRTSAAEWVNSWSGCGSAKI